MAKVLGVDLACSWASLGSAELEFEGSRWVACHPGAIAWPDVTCDPAAVACAVERFVVESGIAAVSLDGPQGWRNPATTRAFCGRQCEWETHTPGKTGPFDVTFPRTWRRWVGFSIEVFDRLLAGGNAIPANDAARRVLDVPPPGKFLILECFPTSTWRASSLSPLKGHYISGKEVSTAAAMLRTVHCLPESAVTEHHDNLQAIVAALPAAGLLGGPCRALPRGEPAHARPAADGRPEHRVEGLIWDAAPTSTLPGRPPNTWPRAPEVVDRMTSIAVDPSHNDVRSKPLR